MSRVSTLALALFVAVASLSAATPASAAPSAHRPHLRAPHRAPIARRVTRTVRYRTPVRTVIRRVVVSRRIVVSRRGVLPGRVIVRPVVQTIVQSRPTVWYGAGLQHARPTISAVADAQNDLL